MRTLLAIFSLGFMGAALYGAMLVGLGGPRTLVPYIIVAFVASLVLGFITEAMAGRRKVTRR